MNSKAEIKPMRILHMLQTWNGKVTQCTENSVVCYGTAAVDGVSVKQREQFDGKVGLNQVDAVIICVTFTQLYTCYSVSWNMMHLIQTTDVNESRVLIPVTKVTQQIKKESGLWLIFHSWGHIRMHVRTHMHAHMCTHTYNHFTALLDFVWDYPGEPVMLLVMTLPIS